MDYNMLIGGFLIALTFYGGYQLIQAEDNIAAIAKQNQLDGKGLY